MPWGSVTLRPGVDVQRTETLNEAGYSSSNLIRFRDGLAQKMGGWQKYYGFAVGGIPRAMHAWQDVNERQHLAIGSTTTLGVITSGSLTDISPQTLSSTDAVDASTSSGSPNVTIVDTNISNVTTYDSVEFLTPISVGGIVLSGVYPIDASLTSTSFRVVASTNATSTVSNGGAVPVYDSTNGSQTVDVTINDHGLSVGSVYVAPTSTSVGGVTVSGTYTVTAVGSVNQFSIAVEALATSTATVAMNSGNASYKYYIALGPAAAGSTYSSSTYSTGGYSTGTAVTAQTGTAISATDWTHDNWGSTILSVPAGGGVYAWTPDTGFQNAKLIANAPPFNGGAFVAAPAQILVAWGSSEYHGIGVDQDPLTLRWSDQLDYEYWTAGATNPSTGVASQAGTMAIPTGSRIVTAIQAPQQALVWTDLGLWSLNYIGNPDVGLTFGLTPIASSCGAIGRHSVGILGNSIFWMGSSNFFAYNGGRVTPMPCTVWDAVFQDLDTANVAKVRACPNTTFNELMWMYPSLSGGTGECDSYVKVNILDGSWDQGRDVSFARSAWIDQSVLGAPIGAASNGVIYQHEKGLNADDQAIEWSFRTGFWMIGEGEDVAFVDFVVPDFKFGLYNASQGANISITLHSVMYPGGDERDYGPYAITSSSTHINTRVRGRQMAMTVSGSDLDSFARLGKVRYRWAPSGRF